ncbi:MAG: translation factor GTPase family protein [Nocardioidaceae bacterium]
MLNLGIVAHVDAGKTSLTERLLFAAGVIDEIGSVDDGTTQADTMVLERQRGITIKSAVVSFVVGDVTVNLIDTPGHPDFIAEVERVLSILDGAVLVVSAVEGVQPQTRILSRALRRLWVPTLVFVNKLDRAGADDARVVRDLADTLALAPIELAAARGIGSRDVTVTSYGDDAAFTARLLDVLTEHDDALLTTYLEDPRSLSRARLREELARQVSRAVLHPVFLGSAITGVGVELLMTALADLLPAGRGDVDAAPSGVAFKVERGPAGERVAFVAMTAGTLRVRDRVQVGSGGEGQVTAISVFERGSATPSPMVAAGQIAKIWGLGEVMVGSSVGAPRPGRTPFRFAPPTLEAVVVARNPADRGALHVALTQLAEQDPLINLRPVDDGPTSALSLYGEVQKEVIGDTLAADFGVGVDFHESTTICIERPVRAGSAGEPLPAGRSAEHPLLAGVGLRIEPVAAGSGVEVGLEIERGSLPRAFLTAIEEAVPTGLSRGLRGWQVTDCRVTITSSGYAPRQSHAHATFDRNMSSTADDFRSLTPVVLMQALALAGTVVCEPMHHFRLELPDDLLGSLLPALARLGAVPRRPEPRAASYLVEGDIPAARVHALQQQLPTLSRGQGVLECAFDHYRPVRGTAPTPPGPFTRMAR